MLKNFYCKYPISKHRVFENREVKNTDFPLLLRNCEFLKSEMSFNAAFFKLPYKYKFHVTSSDRIQTFKIANNLLTLFMSPATIPAINIYTVWINLYTM